jgi:hypothetical protein
MTVQDAPTLDVVLTLARRLNPPDQARLIAELAPQLAQVLESPPAVGIQPFPVIMVGTWVEDLPLRREELYDDRGR